DYDGTRHNVGFMCVDELARRWSCAAFRKRWKGLVCQHAGVWLVKPQTFMNLSGESVRAAVRDRHIAVDRVWLVYDELDLPVGRIRIRRGGSAAGHNGVRSA